MSESDGLHARARAFIEATARGAPPPEPFDDLALAIARFQAARIPAVARLARARGVDLGAARDAAAIPAVPADVFRLARVAAHPASEDVRVFRTSGTTSGARGAPALPTRAPYELAALAWGRALLWPDRLGAAGPGRTRVAALAPHPSEAPDSSLSFMIDLFAAALDPGAAWLVRGGELDVAGLASVAAAARAGGEAVLVLATSFALVHLLDRSAGHDLTLPPASRVMLTGGFKGRSREVDAGALRAAVAAAFGVPEGALVGEYGMTELSSQLYEGTIAGAGPAGVYLAPPWLRIGAVDPVTLAALPDGTEGIARIVDLANVDSAVAILTADRVVVERGGVRLLGRAPGAPPRGCSIAIDEMLGREAGP